MGTNTMPLSAEDLDELHELCTRLYNLARRNGYPGDLEVVYRQARAALAFYQVDAGLPMTGDDR
jgi:hypothetical protein